MPFPCSAPSSPDIAGLPVVTQSLQTTGAAPAAAGNPSADGSQATFDNVLSGLNDAAPVDSTKDDDSKTATDQPAVSDTPPTAEQLAMIATFLLPNAVQLPTQPPAQPTPTTQDQPSLTLVGAEGRSVPELLARGTETLEYNVAPKAAVLAQTPPLANVPTGTSGSSAMPVQRTTGSVAAVAPAATTSVTSDVSTAADVTAQTSPVLPSSTAPQGSTTTGTVSAPVPAPATDTVKAATPDASSDVVVSSIPANSAAVSPSSDATTLLSDSSTAGQLQANAVNAAGGQTVTSVKTLSKGRPGEALEKTAGSPSSRGRSGEYPSAARGKNLSLVVDVKEVTDGVEKVGTAAANWGKTMYQDLRTFADTALTANAGASANASGIVASTTRETVPAGAAIPSHAGELVHEIREIADGLWAVERNSVEVKFNFGEQDKLSVRVEYRDGTVSTTFRTNSADVRDAIAREWQSQTTAADQRPYRMADPVFSAPTSSSGFSMGGDASRQQRSSEQPASADRFFTGSAPRSGVSTTTASVVSPTSRPDTAGRLHAIA